MAPHILFLSLIIFFIFIVHIAFAFGVLIDANRWSKRHMRLFLVPSLIWALAVLVGGLLVVVVYWLIHYSTLRPRPNDSTE